MLLGGFPTDIIGKMDFGNEPYPQNHLLQSIAGNMFPVPTFMAISLATLASVPWSDQASKGEIADTEATLKHDMDAGQYCATKEA